jgi:hypothetical protein
MAHGTGSGGRADSRRPSRVPRIHPYADVMPATPLSQLIRPPSALAVLPPDADVDAVLAAIRSTTGPVSPATFAQWLSHPDERVLTALANATVVTMHGQPTGWSHRAVFVAVLERANAAGLVWTPALDAFAARRQWPQPAHLARLAEEGGPDIAPERPARRVARLGAAIEDVADPVELLSLLEFRLTALHRLVALHAPDLTEAIVERIVGVAPELARTLLTRPGGVPPSTWSTVGAWVVSTLLAPDDATLTSVHGATIGTGIVQALFGLGWTMAEPMRVTIRKALFAAGRARIEDDARDEDRARAHHAASGRRPERGFASPTVTLAPREMALLTLLLIPETDTPADDLDALVRWTWGAPDGLERVAAHPRLPQTTRARIVRDCRTAQVWAAIARTPGAAMDADVAQALLDTGDTHVIAAMARATTGVMFAAAVRALTPKQAVLGPRYRHYPSCGRVSARRAHPGRSAPVACRPRRARARGRHALRRRGGPRRVRGACPSAGCVGDGPLGSDLRLALAPARRDGCSGPLGGRV